MALNSQPSTLNYSLPLFFWLVLWLPCSLYAALPKSVVVTDELVAINGSVIAGAKKPKQEFQISRDGIVAVIGRPTKVNKSWFTSECGWDALGIGLQYRDDIQQCTSLRFALHPEPDLGTFRPYTGAIRVNGVPITPLTDPRVFRKMGFKKSPQGYARTVGIRETVLGVDTHGHIARVTIELPKILDRSID